MTRRGVTLIELLVTMVVVSIIGTGLIRIVIGTSRFVARQDAVLDARQTARAAMNVMLPELRMVSDSGLVSATPDRIVVRVPYAFGLACRASIGLVVASLVPTDSVVFASAAPDGMAWRTGGSGRYAFEPGVSVTSSGNQAACDTDSIRVLPGGSRVAIGTGADTIPPGTPLYLYQTLTYEFAPSTELPGRIGLWRRAGASPNEELAWPFDSSAGFGFLASGSPDPLAAPPSDLTTVQGIELRLIGASELTAQGDDAPQRFDLRPRVTFMNAVQ